MADRSSLHTANTKILTKSHQCVFHNCKTMPLLQSMGNGVPDTIEQGEGMEFCLASKSYHAVASARHKTCHLQFGIYSNSKKQILAQ